MKIILYIMLAVWALLALPGLIVIWWWSGSPLIDMPSNRSGKSIATWLKVIFYYVFPVLAVIFIVIINHKAKNTMK